MMDNIPNLRLEALIDYVLTKRNVCTPNVPFLSTIYKLDFIRIYICPVYTAGLRHCHLQHLDSQLPVLQTPGHG